MALNSINTNVAAMAAQGNIGRASTMAGSSIARLSSGDRIVRAADDVAAMSAGTSLRTNVTTLKMAMVNTAQGSSLLQVADGALAQVTDILQRQKAIAVQAGSGSLTSAERSFLNQEFQNLTQEIDRLADQTNFNGVTLLNGDLFERTEMKSATQEATKATLTLDFTAAVTDGQLMQFTNVNSLSDGTAAGSNGVITFEIEDTDPAGPPNGITAGNIQIGINLTNVTTIAGQVSAIASAINNNAEAGFSAKAVGNSLVLTERAGGASAGGILYDTNTSTVATTEVGRQYIDAAGAAFANYIGFSGGADLGIGRGNTQAIGVMGDTVLAAQRQTFASEGINFATATFAEGNNITFDDGNGGAYTFVFVDSDGASRTPATAPTASAVGAINIEIREYVTAVANSGDVQGARRLVVDRIVEAINNFAAIDRTANGGIVGNADSGVDNSAALAGQDYLFSQINARRDGDTLVMQTNQAGGLLRIDGFTALTAITTTVGNAVLTGAGDFNIEGTNILFNSGVNVNGVNNAAFTGTVQGFDVTYRSSNIVDLSIKVGDRTYSAAGVDLSLNYGIDTSQNPPTLANDILRLTSLEGDYFTIDLQGQTQNLSVNNQTQADQLGARLDKAFSTLQFVQNREIVSFEAAGDIITDGVQTGSLTGSEFSLQTTDFSDVVIRDVKVKAPATGSQNAQVEFNINGSIYRADVPFGNRIGAGALVEFVSLDNGNDVLTFRNGASDILISNAAQATSFETALKEAFGVGENGATIKFQVGVTTEDTLQIGIGSVTTTKIYEGNELNVLTAESAAFAADALDIAIDMVTSVRAEVGALQSRFDFAAANVESSIANQDAARGVLLDTDIAAESTAFATAQVQLQAGISVLAQANLLPQNLLKLIG